MNGISTKKVVGGKLLRIKTEFNDKIHAVQITGDFFLHPEEKIVDIERTLIGLPVLESRQKIIEKIQAVIRREKIELVGISTEDIADTLLESLLVGKT